MNLTAEKIEDLPRGLYRRSGIYYIDYTFADRNGAKRRIRQPVGTNKKVAIQILEKRRTTATENKHLDIRRDEKILFRDFAQVYLDRHAFNNKSRETDIHQLKAINRFIGNKHLHEVTLLDLQIFCSERLKKKKPATVNRNMALIKSIFNRAVEWEKLRPELNPTSKIKKLPENNARLRFLSTEEIQRLYSECRGELLALVQFAVNTGMRRGEIMALTWSDIDLEQQQIYIRDSKSGKSRVIPMNKNVRGVLLSLKKIAGSSRIFASNRREAFNAAVERAELKDVTFHTLRHTAASHLAQAGINLLSISKILGHSTTQMSSRYAHLSPDYQAKAIGILDQVLPYGKETYVTTTSQNAFRARSSKRNTSISRLITAT